MDNHRPRHRRRHRVSSFNPAWCFGPSPTKECSSPKRTTSSDRPCSTATSSRPNHMRLLRFGSMSAALTSPRIGCLGQIKRNKPSNSSSSSSSYSSSSSSSSSSTTSWSSKSSSLLKFAMGLLRGTRPSSKVGAGNDQSMVGVISNISFVEEMDPPLPVVRRSVARDDNFASLWERRCGGEANRGLQIQLPQQLLIN
ncbi:hypothetical protein Cni_G18197 [Canna indica]|uniref:Uncharacterized protein n=1 Tax=Canna indica TaxID=4628 RepID=A0AAQ3KIR5_9LILI|nr:hypothetical protein Cni_G18197 [Canna indica]